MADSSLSNIPWATIKYVGNESKYAKDAIDSSWIAGGSYISKFETCIEHIYSGKAYSVSNGTAALQLALQALSLEPGDKVIVPSFCFQAAANVVIQLGGVPIYCDVDLFSWNQTLNAIENAYQPGVKGVVVVHNYGACHDVQAVSSWCKKANLWLIEDCAEAWFSKVDGMLLGQFSDIATFSMHAAKTITCGEGGLLISYREDLNEKLSQLRSHGLVNSPRPYYNLLAGNNYRLSNIHAAIALGQIENYSEILESQNHRQKVFEKNLNSSPYGALQRTVSNTISLWAIGFRIFSDLVTISRDEVMDLMKEKGIDTRPGFYSTDRLEYPLDRTVFENSSALSKDIIVFPCGTMLSDDEIGRICQEFIEILETHRRFDFAELDLPKEAKQLSAFLAEVNSNGNFFRYFDSRDYSIIENHIETVLLKEHGDIVAYAHLDQDDLSTWIGICVHPRYQRKSVGKSLMNFLIKQAVSKGIKCIFLTVDKSNYNAIRMYENFGFKAVENSQTVTKMSLKLDD